ncbi:hypothetical protein M0638_25140 [Roseomonas sp. NAR14]|uniref:Uncharacterized protein n=1 Tax=Roseomonas acroporae TaxID=2937791 RepID=A0A9X1YD93_9PROT|nr:hypothetical protein [Roseomonas acroporae]MCK8787657.1 hypothetical protein [Roseomonas acroporae]
MTPQQLARVMRDEADTLTAQAGTSTHAAADGMRLQADSYRRIAAAFDALAGQDAKENGR